MATHTRKKKSYDEAQELGDPRPQPQVSGADFTGETIPQNPPPRENTAEKDKEDNDKEAG